MKKLFSIVALLYMISFFCLLGGCTEEPEATLFSINVENNENGTITANATEAEPGTTITVTATPNEGFVFASWSSEVEVKDNSATRTTFVMPESDVVIGAEFVQELFTVVVTSSDPEHGTVMSSHSESTAGERVTIEASPAEGYQFLYWTVESGNLGLADSTQPSTSFIMPTDNVEIRAIFRPASLTFIDSGNLTQTMTWTLYRDYRLVIETSADSEAMPDFVNFGDRPWNEYVGGIKAVVIEDGVQSIGDYAFYDCAVLESVIIPNGVTNIGIAAFLGCTVLENVTIPSGVEVIGDMAFSDCAALPEVNIPYTVLSLGASAFENCTSLRTATITGSIATIAISTFENCTSLTTVTASAAEIDAWAFSGCKALTGFYGNTSYIRYAAFSGCTALMDATFLKGVATISNYAFENCASLGSLTMEYVVSIGHGAFSGCNNLTKVITGSPMPGVGNSIQSIGNGAFTDCMQLTSVTIYAPSPPALGTDNFTVDGDTLYVPKESKGRYTSEWEAVFNYIVALP
jgi:hypothetical protein